MNEQFVSAIGERIQLGHSKEQIIAEAKGAGYSDEDVEAAYNAALSNSKRVPSAVQLQKQIEAGRSTSHMVGLALFLVAVLIAGVYYTTAIMHAPEMGEEAHDTDNLLSFQSENVKSQRVEVTLHNSRPIAEIYFDGNEYSYENLCTSPDMERLWSDTTALQDAGAFQTCNDRADGYVVAVLFKDGRVMCTDSTGYSGEIAYQPIDALMQMSSCSGDATGPSEGLTLEEELFIVQLDTIQSAEEKSQTTRNSFVGVCERYQDTLNSASLPRVVLGGDIQCTESSTGYAAEVYLPTTGTYYCVDSTGYAGESTMSKGTALSCLAYDI